MVYYIKSAVHFCTIGSALMISIKQWCFFLSANRSRRSLRRLCHRAKLSVLCSHDLPGQSQTGFCSAYFPFVLCCDQCINNIVSVYCLCRVTLAGLCLSFVQTPTQTSSQWQRLWRPDLTVAVSTSVTTMCALTRSKQTHNQTVNTEFLLSYFSQDWHFVVHLGPSEAAVV